MNDSAIRELARRAGLAGQWTDYANRQHRVPLDSIARILAALGLPCASANDLAYSRHLLNRTQTPALITVTAGKSVELPIRGSSERPRACLTYEDGAVEELTLRRSAQGIRVPAIRALGYHALDIDNMRLTLAVAPPRCLTIEDIAPGDRLAGLTVQTYGLRSGGDCGIGDMAGVTALASAAAPLGIDALAISPAHSPFTTDHGPYSPYSPSSRLFYDPLLADAASIFGEARLERARGLAASASPSRQLEAACLIDWPDSSRTKMAVLRWLFDDFVATDLTHGAGTGLAADFADFRAARGTALERHGLFEAVRAGRLRADPQAWNWRDWPEQWREPQSANARRFGQEIERDVLFHVFLQWIADRSLAGSQKAVKRAGMRIGLIADLAVGVNASGSDAWASQDMILDGLQIGAPPDLFNSIGQNWGLTTFSPRALAESGFAPFIATLRAGMRHAGGVRIDHAMGFMRLWVIPGGAKASEGAYLAYPLEDLFRLTALESHRHRAIVIGEDLGTVPAGFRGRLARAGIYGTRVLWFERDDDAFAPPRDWTTEAAAMTSTHDLPTVAGWWRGRDLEVRAECGLLKDSAREQSARSKERKALWNAFQSAQVDPGDLPEIEAGSRVANAAVKFMAATPSRLALLPLEDALAMEDQPNLPGTTDKYPNWRRRYPGEAAALLEPSAVRHRVELLAKRAAS